MPTDVAEKKKKKKKKKGKPSIAELIIRSAVNYALTGKHDGLLAVAIDRKREKLQKQIDSGTLPEDMVAKISTMRAKYREDAIVGIICAVDVHKAFYKAKEIARGRDVSTEVKKGYLRAEAKRYAKGETHLTRSQGLKRSQTPYARAARLAGTDDDSFDRPVSGGGDTTWRNWGHKM